MPDFSAQNAENHAPEGSAPPESRLLAAGLSPAAASAPVLALSDNVA